VLLLAATAVSTFWAGATHWDPIPATLTEDAEDLFDPGRLQQGLLYMAALLGILLAHEMGHFLMARRSRVPASLPFFLPMPMLPFGTLGAVIAMQGSRADRRQIFEIGVSGPLAGLMIALPVLWLGIHQLDAAVEPDRGIRFHNPLLLSLAIEWLRPDYPTPDFFCLNQFNPLLMAGWVGILVTGLNMLPVSQLDGGHVAYALMGRHAHTFARGLLIASIVFIIVFERYMWVLMLVVVILLGVDHPPTADDRVRLTWQQRLIGWLAMSLPVLCIPAQGISVTF
jgi:membrane-associated protease RseP (regulator of RpoE activity)